MRWLNGVVYIMNSSGPRTDPCGTGTPYDTGDGGDSCLFVETERVLEVRYEWTQERTDPPIPNQLDKRSSNIW